MYTDVSAGLETRLGLINSTFEFFTQPDLKNPFEAYIFIRPELRVSYFDATLQGTLFRKSPGSYFISNEQKNAFVFHYQTGIELSFKDLNIIASITKHTQEFKGADKWHGWGSIAVSYRF